MKNDILNSGLVSDGRFIFQKARTNPELVSNITESFKTINNREPDTLSEAVFCAYHETNAYICSCGKFISYIDFTNGYRHHCSSKCASLDPESQKKLKETNMVRYGVDNPAKSLEIKEKFKQSMQERYGVNNPMQHPESKDKSKTTNIERYGVEHVLQSAEVRSKGKKTTRRKYGVDHPMQSEIFQNAQRETNMTRLGVEYPMQSEQVLNKYKATLLEKYGVENAMQSQVVKDKTKNTWAERYGVEHPTFRFYSDETKDILFDREKFSDFIRDKSLTTGASILDIDPSTVSDYCKKYDIFVPSSTSSYEREIAEFFTSIGLEFISNSRSIIKPYELDFFVPEHNLAVEFNGLYWHSHERLGDKNYHLKKLSLCENHGIRLLMVNEDEWIQHSVAIKNRIKNICGKTGRGAPGRKLTIRKITNKEANPFVDEYHIQGASSGIISSFGAYDDLNLVGVIQFSKQRGSGKIELIRFCVDNDSHAGMFSKLLSFAISSEGYDHIISFADKRYSIGNVYEVNGFAKAKIIPPDYRYVKNLKTFHKSSFTKKNIQTKFGIDMSQLTERQAMMNLGYRRIYDCGKIRYEWNK